MQTWTLALRICMKMLMFLKAWVRLRGKFYFDKFKLNRKLLCLKKMTHCGQKETQAEDFYNLEKNTSSPTINLMFPSGFLLCVRKFL